MKLFFKILFAFAIGIPALLLVSFSVLALGGIALALVLSVAGVLLAALVPIIVVLIVGAASVMILLSVAS